MPPVDPPAGYRSPYYVPRPVATRRLRSGPGRPFRHQSHGTYYDYVHSIPGLKSYWRMRELSGSLGIDEMGAVNLDLTNMTMGSIASPILTDSGFCFGLDGTSAWANAAAPPWTLGDTWTLSYWLQRTATGGTTQRERIADRLSGLQSLIDDTVLDAWNVTSQTSGSLCTATVSLTDTNWHFYVVTKSGSTVKMYQDAVDVTGTVTNFTISGESGNFAIGRHRSSAVDWVKGNLAEYFVATTAISATAVTELYQAAGYGLSTNWVRTLTDSVTQSDAWARVATYIRTETESVTQSDAWTRIATYLRTLSESVTQSDSWARVATYRRTLTESVTQSDAWARVATYLRTLTQTVTQADAWTRTATYIRTWSETVTQSDAWVGLRVIIRTLAESVTQSDAWTRTATYLRTLTQTVTQADSWARVATNLRSWSDSVTQSDAWTRTATLRRTFTDSVTQADAWVRQLAGAVVGGIKGPTGIALSAIARGLGLSSGQKGSAGSTSSTGTAGTSKPNGSASNTTPDDGTGSS